MQLTITWLKILGVSTYGWTPQGQKLGVSGHRGHQWIVAYAIDFFLGRVTLDQNRTVVLYTGCTIVCFILHMEV